jgi:hypothetical protein
MAYNNGSNGNSNSDQKLRFCGLWKNTPKNGGESYLSGTIGGAKILIFKNGFKKSDDSKEPDFVVYLAQNQPKEGGAVQAAAQSETDLF